MIALVAAAPRRPCADTNPAMLAAFGKRLAMGLALLAFGLCLPMRSPAGVVYTQNFEGGQRALPPEWSSGAGTFGIVTGSLGSGVLLNDTQGNPAPASVLRLEGLGPHTALSLGFLLNTIGSWDGTGPGFPYNDFFNVAVDGVPVFSEAFGGSFSGYHSYVPPPGVQTGGDTYDMSRESRLQLIPHTAAAVTIAWYASGVGWQGGGDESWAIDNVVVSTNAPWFGIAPTSGFVGDTITIVGTGLDQVVGVAFNGISATYIVMSQTLVRTVVPLGATSGPVTLYFTNFAPLTGPTFVVYPRPSIAHLVPSHGKPNTTVHLYGRDLNDLRAISFGDWPNPAFAVVSDTECVATVSWSAFSGPIIAVGSVASTTSEAVFTVDPLDARPRLMGVKDVPRDQGGRVFVYWQRSDNDYDRHDGRAGSNFPPQMTRYRIWRRLPALNPVLQGEATSIVGSSIIRTLSAPGKADQVAEYWELVGELPARALDGYAFTAATTQDSMADSNPYTAFFVEASNALDQGGGFYDSAVDSGYSVDNLAPPAPTPFTLMYATGGVALHWGPSTAPDFALFRLHRGSSPDFVPGLGNLVTAQADTGYFDAAGTSQRVYKLAAVDVHGNVGRYAVVSPAWPTAALATFMPPELGDGWARLQWYLSADGQMEVLVYRKEGDGGWVSLGQVVPDGEGYVRWEDTGLTPGVAYAYRLVIRGPGASEVLAGEGSVILPSGVAGSRLRIPSPVTTGDVTVSFVGAPDRTTDVRVFDLNGRCVASTVVRGSGARQLVTVAHASDLPPGVYLVRLGGPGQAGGRFVVFR